MPHILEIDVSIVEQINTTPYESVTGKTPDMNFMN